MMFSFPLIEYAVAFISLYCTVFYSLILISYRDRIYEDPSLLPRSALPTVSIVIPMLNEQGVISKTIESVLALDYPKRKLEVIVVDDGSEDGSVEEVLKFSSQGVKLVKNKHIGIGKSSALNAGIKQAKGEFIATIDSDSFPTKNALHQLVSFFPSDPSIKAVTAAVKVHSTNTIIEKIQGVEYIFGMCARRLFSFMDSVTVTPGPLSVFRKSVFDEIGLFDESSLAEDQEMACRIQAHNYRIVCSLNADVYTQAPSTFKQLMSQRIRWNRGSVRNFYKYRNLISFKYGDFGTVVFPLGVLAIFPLIAIFILFTWQLANSAWGIIASGVVSYSFEELLYSFSAVHGLSIVIVLTAVFWLLSGKLLFEKEKKILSAKRLVLFVLTYTYIMAIYWAATIQEEVFGKKKSW